MGTRSQLIETEGRGPLEPNQVVCANERVFTSELWSFNSWTLGTGSPRTEFAWHERRETSEASRWATRVPSERGVQPTSSNLNLLPSFGIGSSKRDQRLCWPVVCRKRVHWMSIVVLVLRGLRHISRVSHRNDLDRSSHHFGPSRLYGRVQRFAGDVFISGVRCMRACTSARVHHKYVGVRVSCWWNLSRSASCVHTQVVWSRTAASPVSACGLHCVVSEADLEWKDVALEHVAQQEKG